MFVIFFNSIICLLFRFPSFILSFLFKEDEKHKGNEKDEISLFGINKWYIALELFFI